MSDEHAPEQSNQQSHQTFQSYGTKNSEKKDITEYPYPNKEIESLWNNFVCDLFNINPKITFG